MDSHIRVYIDANWEALRCLPLVAYKVLLCLVQRADNLGRSFPSAERIAEDVGCHVETIWKALKNLEDSRYIGYLRRNEQDLVTGRWLPNVYIVNPHFICIALEHQESALKLWTAVYSNHPLPYPLKLGTNQQQEPAPETSTRESESRNNNNNQHFSESVEAGETLQSPESAGEKSKKAKSEKQKRQTDSQAGENQQGEAPQRSKKPKSSAAPYRNPDPIAAPIPDGVLEGLATRVNGLGVPIALARGFVVGYGAALVETALLQVAAAKRNGQDFKNEAGFFRHILQNNLVDSSLPEILKPKNNNPYAGLTWADLAEN